MTRADTSAHPAGSAMPSQGVPRLDDSFQSRATRRIRNIHKQRSTMSTKASTPDLEGLSDDALAREILSTTYTIATSARDPHFGRPTKEEGLRRVGALSGTIESQTHDLAHELTAQLGKGEGTVATGDLARFASLIALADPSHPVWTSLLEAVSAPDHPARGPIWSTATDAERDGERAEALNSHAAATARLTVLADERERRRIAEEDAIEAERVANYRAKAGVS